MRKFPYHGIYLKYPCKAGKRVIQLSVIKMTQRSFKSMFPGISHNKSFLPGRGILMQKLSEKKKVIVEEMMKEAFHYATCSVLEECGWPGLTMERVAEKAGVSKRTVYNYFKDKRELVWFVMERLISDLEQNTREIFLRNTSCAEALRELIREEMVSRKKNANIMTAFLHAFHEEPELRKQMFHKQHPFFSLQEMLKDLLERGMEKGEFRSMDPVAMRSILNAILMGVSRQWAGGHLTLPQDVMSDSIISLLTNGLIIKGEDRP